MDNINKLIKESEVEKSSGLKSCSLYFEGQEQISKTSKLVDDNRHIYILCDSGSTDDYLLIIESIKKSINPDDIEYYGFADVIGYFKKNDIKVDVIHEEEFEDNFMIINPKDFSTEQIDMIDKWVVTINKTLRETFQKKNESGKSLK